MFSRSLSAFLVLVGLLASASSYAGLRAISVNAGIPQAIGKNWQSLSGQYSLKTEGWVDGAGMAPGLDFHLQLDYQAFQVRNNSKGNFGVITGLAGLMLRGGPEKAPAFGFFGLDVGTSYELLWWSGATAGVYTGTFGFTVQLTPGVEVPISNNSGLVFETPIRWIIQRSTLAVWEASLGFKFGI